MTTHLFDSLSIVGPKLGDIPDQGALIIGELARISGVDPKTIRFYERAGLLSPKRQGRFRIFSKAEAERLVLIRSLRNLGVPIKAIKTILASEPLNKQNSSSGTYHILEEHLSSLQRRREELNSNISTISKLLNNS